MMKRFFSLITSGLLLTAFWAMVLPGRALAVLETNESLGCIFTSPVGSPAGAVPTLGCLAEVVTAVINIALTFLGLVAILFLLWGSIKFILSGGNEKSVKAARDMITYALIGTALVALTFFLIRAVTGTFGLPDILSNFTFYQKP